MMAMAQSIVPFSVRQFMEEQSIRSFNSALGPQMKYVAPRMVDGREMVDAFIAIQHQGVIQTLQRHGVVVNCPFDGFVTAQIPMDQLLSVSQLPGVTDIEISQRAELCTDSTLSVTHAGQVINGLQNNLPQAYDGSGVIVGIIDKGFDFRHRAFRSSDDLSSTRIVRVYNTQVNNGHPAYYNKTYKIPGSVFMGNEILSLTTDCSGDTHGTHTTGIAAGSHVNGYGGMAPGADIVMCAISENDGSLSVVELANCVRYIDSYADSVGKPCVMSLSISVPAGQHDGNDYFSKAVAQTMGKGRIFVISAGNTGGKPNYAHKKITQDNPMNLLFKCKSEANADSSYNYTYMLSEIWMRNAWKRFNFKFHIFDFSTRQIVWESEQYNDDCLIKANEIRKYYAYDASADTTGYIKVTRKTSSDGRRSVLNVSIRNLVCQEYSLDHGMKKSRYVIGISLTPQTDDQCDVDAWASNSYAGFGLYNGIVKKPDGSVTVRYYTAGNDSCSIGTYAVNSSIISAGAYAARNSYYSYNKHQLITDNTITVGDIASFSSYQYPGAGPTGEALPTVCAPGVNVVSAGSRYSYFAQGSVNTVMKSEDGSWWGVMSGTSMSSPTVAGIIALWLQANPNLTPSEIKDIIAQTAIHDSYTTGPNQGRFGPNGKIDAMAGMRKVLADLGYGMGDVDGNGEANIYDLTCLIDYLLGKKPIGFSAYGADVNRDGVIDIADIAKLIDFLLNSQH